MRPAGGAQPTVPEVVAPDACPDGTVYAASVPGGGACVQCATAATAGGGCACDVSALPAPAGLAACGAPRSANGATNSLALATEVCATFTAEREALLAGERTCPLCIYMPLASSLSLVRWAVITPLLLLLRLSPFYTGGRRLERDLSAATACRRLCRNRMGRIETVFSQRSLPNELPSTVNVQFSEAEALCECGGVISDQGAIRWSQRTTWTFSWRA